MPSKLDQLRAMTVVVADTGDLDAVRRLKPQDCTTNPTLLLKAVEIPAYGHLLEEALAWGRKQGGSREGVVAAICDRLAVAFGAELAGIVPGRVSTEVDADLSFDTQATVEKARAIIEDYEERGIGARADPDQDRLDLGGHPRGGDPSEGGHRLQPHAAVQPGSGPGLRGGGRVPDLALRRPHPRLARQGRRRTLYGARPIRACSPCARSTPTTSARHHDRGDGRLLPQHRRDRGARRLRPADHLARAARGAGRRPTARCRASSRPTTPRRAGPGRRIDEPASALR